MEQPVDKETAKERFRASRLQWSNQAEHRLRQELNDIAIAKCRHVTEQFASCAREQGLMVVFRCREQNKAMNDCLHQYTNPEQFAAYKEKREQEMAQALE
ncbi:hypothetical protein P43SY_004776 [Pythium insidiosum]|uniref:COX assembly mitochondrial protein n=1 Tax=Pythium insidiosum TaxID=114742 RepID=A0AAD5Q9R0_PYTIN|nr:hypothetical protein P43SY_004776 [Pythium insidiosum]KAJ0411268.1 hypothetical protein ATCC90586_004184 [Pythium insidiosum]